MEVDAEELAYRSHVTRPDPEWHATEADRFERAGDLFAAAFHLGRLASLRPWDAALLHARRAARLAELGRTDQAAVAYVQAVLADPAINPRSLPKPHPSAKVAPAIGQPIERIPAPRIGP